MTSYFRMFDPEPRGMLEVAPTELGYWNERQFGAYWTLCEFNGPRRIENVVGIENWAVDLDQGDKVEQWRLLKKSPLIPTRIVETKRGFHVYWRARGARKEHWKAIVEYRLVPFFHADTNAKDLARVLRVPGFFHWKDPKDPFLVRCRLEREGAYYTEHQMAAAFRSHYTPAQERADFLHEAKSSKALFPSDRGDFWERVHELDSEEALSRLSGHWSCGGERFTFRRVGNGNLNILVDGKQCSAWIDRNKRIGSHSKGGPNPAMWIRWYGHDWPTVAKVLKDLFPHLERR